MPSPYTPVAVNHATISVPIDTDPPNASATSTPLEQVADNVAYTKANWLPLIGGTMVGDIVLNGGLFGSAAIDDENINSVPGIVSNVQAATSHKKWIASWLTGPNVAGSPVAANVYSAPNATTGQLEIVQNAFWNDTTGHWSYDTNTQPAMRTIHSGGGGVIVQKYSGGAPWNDGDWVTETITGGAGANLEADATSTTPGLLGVASAAQAGIRATTALAGDAVNASTSGAGRAVHGSTSGTGSAGLFTTSGAGDALDATSNGSGAAGSFTATSTGDAVDIVTTGAGTGLSIVSLGVGNGLGIDVSGGSGVGISVVGNGSHPAISGAAGVGQAFIRAAAPGGGGSGVNAVSTNGDPALLANASSSGPAVQAVGTASCLQAGLFDMSACSGYGIQITANATRAHLRMIPLAATPTVAALGDWCVTNDGAYHVFTGGVWRNIALA